MSTNTVNTPSSIADNASKPLEDDMTAHSIDASEKEKRPDDIAVEMMTANANDIEYATGFRLFIIMATIILSTLIAALDLGIVATAIPAISMDFHALNDIAWYSGACFLLVGATSAQWGKLYKYFLAQYIYMIALFLYLIGSIVAASAPSSIALIVGRAIQGWGCAGCLGGSVIIINYTAQPAHRPLLIGVWMGVFMVATVLGPLIGGVFTTEITWRWCFWINLPIGGAAIVLQLLFLRIPKHVKPAVATWREIVLQMDIPGFSFIVSSLVCYTLALQWGGLTAPWSDGNVVATLTMWAVLTVGFFVVEWVQGSYAILPLRLLTPRLTWTNLLYCFLANAANFIVLFYLPIYFQSIKGTSAIISGVYNLPFVAFYALGALISGAVISKTRLLQPLELTSALLAVVGAALLYSMGIDTSKAWYIGAQIPFGLGIGLGNQIPVTALQAFAKPEDIATTTGIVFTCQTISGAYFNTAAQSIFENRMIETVEKLAPDISSSRIIAAGASSVQSAFSGEELDVVLRAYMVGVKDVFTFALATAAVTVLLALVIPLKKLPDYDEKTQQDREMMMIKGET